MGVTTAVDRLRADGAGRVAGGDSDADRSVVFVSQQYPPDRSGHASRIHDTATTLADEGWSVTVLAPPPSFPPGTFDRRWTRREQRVDEGVTVVRLWSWQPTRPDPGFLSRLCYYATFALHALVWTVVHARQYDVVVTTTPPISTGIAGLPAVLPGRRWVVDVRDLWIDAAVSLGFIAAGGVLERLSRSFQRQVLRAADGISVTTETLGERLTEQYGHRLEEKLVLVPNGVDMSRFHTRSDGGETVDHSPGPGLVSPTRQPADCPATREGPYTVVYTGNIGHAQNLDACVEALDRMETDAVLRLVGGGDAVPRLRELAAATGVTDCVEFVGTVPHDQIPELLDDSHVGIAPLKPDEELAYAMPTKVYEYLGSGLPVVVTGQGELRRFVEDAGAGRCAADDPDSIAAALDSMLADRERREAAGRRGYEYVRTRYDRERIARRFGTYLRTLCRGGVATDEA